MENAELILLLNKELAIEITEKESYEKIHAQLADYINGLIKNDFDKLISNLYRIDVNEQKLKSLLQQNPQEDAGNLIATLIIERQKQKLKTREHSDNYRNSQRDYDLPAGQAGFDEEEKW